MIIYENIDQGTEEWLKIKEGKLSSSRVKGLLFDKVMNKTDVINYLLSDYESEIKEKYEEKELKKEITKYKKTLSELPQSDLEKMIPSEMYEEAFTKTQKKGYYRLLAEKLGYKDDELEDPRDRGHRLESEAADKIEKKTGLPLSIVGFITRSDHKDIALSPDRMIQGPTAGGDIYFVGGVEIKSPGVVNHLEIWKTKKVPSEYWDQVIQYFVVGDVDYVIFASYNPLVKECPLVTITIKREDVLEDIEESLQCQINIVDHLKKDIEELTF